MKGYKMLKTSLPDHQTTWLLTKSCLVYSNVYNLLANSFDKNVVLSFRNININFSIINIGRKVLYIRVLYEVRILKTKRHSTEKALAEQTFCRNACTCRFVFLSQYSPNCCYAAHLHVNFVFYSYNRSSVAS
jgi:hypothetical protein